MTLRSSIPALTAACLCLASIFTAAGEQAAEHGADLILPFKQQLKSALMEGMEAGPPEAITICKDQAPAIADSLSVNGVLMGRASHRLRNPDNTAPGWVAPLLADMLEQGGDASARSVALGNDRTGYVEPILTAPLCLACHGSELAPGIAARIEALYPEDEATGFEAGDLRGVFWVEYPVSGTQTSSDD